MSTTMRIDSHQHFWRIARRQGHWPPSSLAPLHHDFVPADLLPELWRCGIDCTVLVQSIPTPEDTTLMLNLAARREFVRGVVGWVDMKAADAPAQITALARHRKLKGLRPMLQDLADEHWIDDCAVDPAADAMLEHSLCFDALVQPRHLTALLAFVRRHPALPIVIDYAAKPEIGSTGQSSWHSWHRHMTALAASPNVHCKLAGLLAEVGENKNKTVLRPCFDHLFASFSAGHLMWGSDWPVVRLAGEYDAWFAMAHRLCSAQPGVQGDAPDAIFGGNACRFYRLDLFVEACMQRMGRVIGTAPEHIAEYKRLHADVWPGVLRRLRVSGFTNYSIFLRQPENLLFGYWEYHGSAFAADTAAIAAEAETQCWWELCMTCQASLTTRLPGEHWAFMEQAFHLH